MLTLVQEIRYALRGLGKNPGLAAAAVLSLGLGVGANTAIFSVTSALLLHQLPYADADRLVLLWNRSPGLNIAEDWFSTAQYFDIKSGHRGFEDLAVALGANYNLTGDGDPARVGVIRVSSNLLPMLGVRPIAGRLFQPEEDNQGRPGTAVLSHGLWTTRYGGDPQMLGRSITLNGQSYEIVGVLPDGFRLPREVMPTLGVVEDGEIFLPLPLGPQAPQTRTREDYNIIGKLARGVSSGAAQAEMDAITARLRRDFPDFYPPNGGLTFSVVPLLDQVVGDVRRTLLLLSGAVGFVLLIACANVANLLLARALARQREMAVRAALGASRPRIARQLLVESLLLSFAGGVLGVGLAFAGVRWIQLLQPKDIPRLSAIAINVEVLVFTIALCIVAGVLFGLAPILGVYRLDLQRQLQEASRGSAGAGAVWSGSHNFRRMLVTVELALSVVLLVGAGLLIRSFAHVQDVAPGFIADRVLTAELSVTGRRYPDAQAVSAFYRELWDRLAGLPGVTAAGAATPLPMSQYFAWGPITVEGRIPPAGENFINADQRVASSRYFEAMNIPLLRGRFFDERDTAQSTRVVIIDDHMAQQLWPNEDPIGRRIRYGDLKSTSPWETVVGVVGRVKQYALDLDSRIAFYRPHTQSSARTMYLVVRSDGDASSVAAAVTKEIRALDPDLPVSNVRTMTSRIDESLVRRRFSMMLLGIFAGLAFVLAAIGIYGVMAYLVSQGTQEIGIRMALGATPSAILGLVLQQGLTIALAGVTIGVAAAMGLTRLMRGLLFGVEPIDPVTFATTALALAVTALAACSLPARRAARIDPLVALK
ncbi:MAG: ABC transporter permease [Acidobacteriota bacterium]